MWTDYLESFASADHTLLGRSLRPYCSYHHLWLRVAESPLILGGNVSLGDLELASRICSTNYGEAQNALLPRRFEKWRIALNHIRFDLPAELQRWNAYQADYCPKIDRDSANPHSTSTVETYPSELWIVTGLMTNLGMSKEEAWMTPMAEAEWYYEMSKLHAGNESSLVKGQDREFRAGILRMRREKEAVKNGNN